MAAQLVASRAVLSSTELVSCCQFRSVLILHVMNVFCVMLISCLHFDLGGIGSVFVRNLSRLSPSRTASNPEGQVFIVTTVGI
jgi:hypothetical protein